MGSHRFVFNPGTSVHKDLTKQLSVDLSADIYFYGHNDHSNALDQRLTQHPTTEWQTYLNYAWNKGFNTSIGYQGHRGGSQYLDGTFNGSMTDYDEIRFAAAKSVSQHFQILGELNHQFAANGGFRQNLGASIRLVYIF
ncbi:hypothetical protein [Sphingomonas abietis]|uniref:Porin n=1 Tax=Sphingomonas abietis TaxID=3012344 RepID=A0ABY7NXP6_9SPHN|nr:hypothetical protein [Sphingomonas abietis]WBO24689.1 hypothetical protein PBT88_17750 [Sphingomonas abietis]